MRGEIRDWCLARQTRHSLRELLGKVRPIVQGWTRYYGLFQPSHLCGVLQSLDAHLVQWARSKYKSLKSKPGAAWAWLKGIQAEFPTLWPHWRASLMTTGR